MAVDLVAPKQLRLRLLPGPPARRWPRARKPTRLGSPRTTQSRTFKSRTAWAGRRPDKTRGSPFAVHSQQSGRPDAAPAGWSRFESIAAAALRARPAAARVFSHAAASKARGWTLRAACAALPLRAAGGAMSSGQPAGGRDASRPRGPAAVTAGSLADPAGGSARAWSIRRLRPKS